MYTHEQFVLTLIRIMTREGHSFVSPGLITVVTSKLVSVLLFAVVFHLLPASFKFTINGTNSFQDKQTNKHLTIHVSYFQKLWQDGKIIGESE
jgi:hypothetical protein